MFRSVITGTGSYIPPTIQSNAEFANHTFYADNHQPLNAQPGEIVEKFRQITGIAERRYISDELNTSDIASIAARSALEDSGIDPETLDPVLDRKSVV